MGNRLRTRLRAGGGGGLSAIISALYPAGSDGATYLPGILLSGFQDSAATIQLTQPGGGSADPPVGYRTDQSGKGNHALQATGASRPTLSGIQNLLLKTEEFNDAVWTLNGMTITANQTTAPDGTATADLVTLTLTGVDYASIATTAQNRTASCYFKAGNSGLVMIATAGAGAADTAYFNVSLGTVGALGANNTASGMTDVGNGWYRCWVTRGNTAGATTYFGNFTGTSGNTFYMWGAQLEDGALSAYQKIDTTSVYSVPTGRLYDWLDGTADNATSTAGGGGTTGFFYCAAVKVRGGAGTDRTLIADSGANTGFRVRINASNKLELAAGDNVSFTTAATAADATVGQTYVLTAWDDGTNLNVQINQGTVAQTAFGTTTAGTAGFTIGKDNGAASGFAAVQYYAQFYKKNGGNEPAGLRAQIQQYCASQAGVTL